MPGRKVDKLLINWRMDSKIHYKQLHQLQLRGIADTRIHRRIDNKAFHWMVCVPFKGFGEQEVYG